MDKKSKVIIAIIAVVVVVLGAAGAYSALLVSNQAQNNTQTQTTEGTQQPAESKQKSTDSTVSYDGQDGRTALEILKGIKPVETKVYSGIGEMVVSIDGVKPADSSEFWAFYVDGKQAQVGADQYVTKNKEKIEWKLEKIQ